jgi:hypothetical protein
LTSNWNYYEIRADQERVLKNPGKGVIKFFDTNLTQILTQKQKQATKKPALKAGFSIRWS